MALGNDPLSREAQCYESKRPGHSADKGSLITPWRQLPSPRREEAVRFTTPAKDDPSHLVRLKEDLALGRALLPKVSATVSAAPSPRVQRAFGSLQVFDSIDSPATAYDAQIAAGPDHLLVATNYDVAVVRKTDGVQVDKAALMNWFSTVLPAGVSKVFDPRVLYDQHDDRWVLVASGAHFPEFTSGVQLLSVSRTSDPQGEWWVWGFPETVNGTAFWPDHPTLGVDAHALYLSANIYIGTSGGNARLRVIPKNGPYVGDVVNYTEFVNLRSPKDSEHDSSARASTVFPCHTWGAPGVQYLVSTRDDKTNETMVTLWTVTDPTGDSELTCTSVPVLEYVYAVPPVPQRDGRPVIAGDAKVRSAIFSGGSIWFAFATTLTVDGSDVAAIRWYQLNPTAGRPVQEGTFALSGAHHCYPAIVPDMHGNAALIVGRSSSSEHISIHLTARRATDPLNKLPPTQLLHAGLAVHDNPDKQRWGDYHGAVLDPTDGVTLWVYGAYPKTDLIWGTVIGRLRV